MAYKPPLEVGELQSLNGRCVRDWIERNKSRIKARPNRTILYSGRDYDLEVIPDLKPEDRKEFMGTPMWKAIEKMRAELKDVALKCEFETLEDVLKKIHDHPVIVDKDRLEQRFGSAYECFANLAKLKGLLPDPRGLERQSWDRLSEIFASNAVGDVQIMDGVSDDYRKLREDKILLRKELAALLRNPNLSDAAKKLVEKKISIYGAQFDRRYTQLIKALGEDRERLQGRR